MDHRAARRHASRAGATTRATSRSSSAAPTGSIARQARSAAAVLALSALTLPHGAGARHAGRADLSRGERCSPAIPTIASDESEPHAQRGRRSSISPREARAGRSCCARSASNSTSCCCAKRRGGRATSSKSRTTASPRDTTSKRIARTKADGRLAADATRASCRRGRCSAPTPKSCSTARSSASRSTRATRRAMLDALVRAARTRCSPRSRSAGSDERRVGAVACRA